MISRLRAVRVEEIMVEPTDSPPKNWSLGNIRYSEIIGPKPLSTKQLPTARPLWNNISQYPTVNEIVYLVTTAHWDFNSTGKVKEYYLPPVNILGSPNHNALPSQLTFKESLSKTETGETGYFVENSGIRPLLPYEGDIAIEGRQGSSIRFGMTVSGSSVSPPWSEEVNKDNIGRPITIIRNGQKNLNEEDTIPNTLHILEDINKDHSSIYLCSNQRISNFQKAGIGFKDYEPSYKHML